MKWLIIKEHKSNCTRQWTYFNEVLHFLYPFSFCHVCCVFVLHWGCANIIRFVKMMAPPFQVPKHFKFNSFSPHVGSNSWLQYFNSILSFRSNSNPNSKKAGKKPIELLELLDVPIDKKTHEIL